jgi:hypothetical protein
MDAKHLARARLATAQKKARERRQAEQMGSIPDPPDPRFRTAPQKPRPKSTHEVRIGKAGDVEGSALGGAVVRGYFPIPVESRPVQLAGGYSGYFLPEDYHDTVIRDTVNARLLGLYEAAAEGVIPYGQMKRRDWTVNLGLSLEEGILFETVSELLGIKPSVLIRRALFSYLKAPIPPRNGFQATVSTLRKAQSGKGGHSERPQSAIEKVRATLKRRSARRAKQKARK